MGVSGQALLTSCIMSIPCSVAISKLRYPETEESDTKESAEIPSHQNDDTSNILHALGKGADVGIKISLLILANIISILATLYAVNSFLTWLGNFINIKELTLELITGYLFVPVSKMYCICIRVWWYLFIVMDHQDCLAYWYGRQRFGYCRQTHGDQDMVKWIYCLQAIDRYVQGSAISKISACCNLCIVWICKSRQCGYASRCAERFGTFESRRHSSLGYFSTHLRLIEHLAFSFNCWYAHLTWLISTGKRKKKKKPLTPHTHPGVKKCTLVLHWSWLHCAQSRKNKEKKSPFLSFLSFCFFLDNKHDTDFRL